MPLYEKMESPDFYALDITPGDNGADLSLVSSAELVVQRSDHVRVVWPATLSNQTATTLTVTYVFALGGGDLPKSGTYNIYARLYLTGGGSVKTDPQNEPVNSEFQT